MGAMDRYITVDRDGTVHLHEENDGWSFLSNPQHDEKIISLKELKATYPDLYREAVAKLEGMGISRK